LSEEKIGIYMDVGCYEISKWGAESAIARGVPVRRFSHHDHVSLCHMLSEDRKNGLTPVIATDGFCPMCGAHSPISQLLEFAESHAGYLVIDDTQALGVFGCKASTKNPFGAGGGGSLQYFAIKSPNVVICGSLAKAFGAPLAVIAGSAAFIQKFRLKAETPVHCSPPSSADIQAARRSISLNADEGNRWRSYVAVLVSRFRARVLNFDVPTRGSIFPVVNVDPQPIADAKQVHRDLLDGGVKTVLTKSCRDGHAVVTFIMTTLHDPADVDSAADALSRILGIAKTNSFNNRRTA
jgi:8-amino-7-oxononanoate synthase